jgi:hypothetical protein
MNGPIRRYAVIKDGKVVEPIVIGSVTPKYHHSLGVTVIDVTDNNEAVEGALYESGKFSQPSPKSVEPPPLQVRYNNLIRAGCLIKFAGTEASFPIDASAELRMQILADVASWPGYLRDVSNEKVIMVENVGKAVVSAALVYLTALDTWRSGGGNGELPAQPVEVSG